MLRAKLSETRQCLGYGWIMKLTVDLDPRETRNVKPEDVSPVRFYTSRMVRANMRSGQPDGVAMTCTTGLAVTVLLQAVRWSVTGRLLEPGNIPDFAARLATPVRRGGDLFGKCAYRLGVAERAALRTAYLLIAIGRSIHGSYSLPEVCGHSDRSRTYAGPGLHGGLIRPDWL